MCQKLDFHKISLSPYCNKLNNSQSHSKKTVFARIKSNIPQLEKAPNQVLKFIICDLVTTNDHLRERNIELKEQCSEFRSIILDRLDFKSCAHCDNLNEEEDSNYCTCCDKYYCEDCIEFTKCAKCFDRYCIECLTTHECVRNYDRSVRRAVPKKMIRKISP